MSGSASGTLRVAGIMSGTSFDAVDVAVAHLRRDASDPRLLHLRPMGLVSCPIDPALRERIAALLPPATTSIEEVSRLHAELGRLFARAAAAATAQLGEVDLVVSHGQTVHHWVEDGQALGTLQLGAPAWIAEATGAAVLSDVRTRDIARGGQGAPLAAMLDALLGAADGGSGEATTPGPRRGSLNLGGIANITVPGPQARSVLAYDIGPAGALLDLVVARASGRTRRMDEDGALAARGRVDPMLLARLREEPYYRLPAPKSTGKELFDGAHLDAAIARTGAPAPTLEDLLATLVELTAGLVAESCTVHRLEELVVAGGGVRNPVLMARIAELAPGTRVLSSAELGLDPQAKEAYLMALVGWLSWHGLPGTLESATGASSLLGSFTPGRALPRFPADPGPMPTRLVIDPI